MRFDPLQCARGRKVERSGRGTGQGKLSGKAAGERAQRTFCRDPGRRQVGHDNRRGRTRRQPDGAFARESPEPRPTTRPPRIPIGIGIQRQMDGVQRHRFVRAGQHHVDLRAFNVAVKHEAHYWAILRLPPAPFEMEGSVAPPIAIAVEREPRRFQLEIDEMDDAVRPARQLCVDHRKAAREPGKEAVVQPPHPGLSAPADLRAVTAGTRHDLQLAFDIDNAETGDQVAVQLACQPDIVTASDEVHEQRQLARKFVGLEDQPVPDDRLAGHTEWPGDGDI